MTGKEFINSCTACGGNWAAMLMSGIKRNFPEYYKDMPEKEYEFDELFEITAKLGVEWSTK